MAAKKTVKKEIPPALEQMLKTLAEQYNISDAFQDILQEKIEKVTKPKTLSEKFESGGLFGLAKDALSRRAQKKLESKTSTGNQQLDALPDNKNILQKFLGLGNIFKLGNLLSPVKKDNKQAAAETPVLSTTNGKTANQSTITKPAASKEKDLIKDASNIQTVLIGGVTDEGARNLQEKMPVILKDVLDELRKIFKEKETTVKTAPSSATDDGGGLLGNLLDFFEGRGGKKPARAKRGTRSRNARARKLKAQRAARKTGTGTTIKTAETSKRSIPKDGTSTSKAARSAKAQELRAERAARKISTGTTLKASEKAETTLATKASEKAETTLATKAGEKAETTLATKASEKAGSKAGAKVATKALGKTAAKAGGKALLKSGLKKIPILGAVAGLGFGAQRALAGDWLGAAGEVASGAAGSIPGLGTAASVGIDAALAARDIYKETQPATSEQPNESSTVTSDITPEKGLEGNEQLKPAFTPPPETANEQPPIQPVSSQTSAGTPPSPGDGNKDILSKIAENTGNTNSSINTLVQAIYKLAQSIGKGGSAPVAPIVMNNQQQSSGPSASQVAASNNDPIRGVRSQFNP